MLTLPFDTSYQFAIELEWLVTELTCVLLVFCVPALPKIVSEHTVLFTSRVSNVWRSWTRLGRGSQTSDSKRSNRNWDQAWPRTIGSLPNLRQRVTDEELLKSNGDTLKNALELSGMRDHHNETNGHSAQVDVTQPNELGIVKTIEFDRHDDAASRVPAIHHVQQQHPWMKH